MRRVVLLGLALVAGCQHHPPREPSPAVNLAMAEEQILAQRVIKQLLIKADPIERKVEAHLRADPRVLSAQFAIIVATFGYCQRDDTQMSFSLLVTTHAPMAEDDARQLLQTSLQSAGYRVSAMTSSLDMHGTTWGLRWGLLMPLVPENPMLPTTRP